MKEGFVIWDDENTDNQNEAGGVLPAGLYSDDTKILFCCKTKGDVDRPILLPADRDFLLFSYESIKCQKVISSLQYLFVYKAVIPEVAIQLTRELPPW